MSNTQITCNNLSEHIDVIEEMVDMMAKESNGFIPDIIDDISKYYGVSKKYIRILLMKIHSKYVGNKAIRFYDELKPIHRTTYEISYKNLVSKFARKLKHLYNDIEDGSKLFLEHVTIILTQKEDKKVYKYNVYIPTSILTHIFNGTQFKHMYI